MRFSFIQIKYFDGDRRVEAEARSSKLSLRKIAAQYRSYATSKSSTVPLGFFRSYSLWGRQSPARTEFLQPQLVVRAFPAEQQQFDYESYRPKGFPSGRPDAHSFARISAALKMRVADFDGAVAFVTLDIGVNDAGYCADLLENGAALTSALPCLSGSVSTVLENLPNILDQLKAASPTDVPII